MAPGQVHPSSAPEAPMLYNDKMPGATVGPLPPPATYNKPYRRRHRGGLAGCCCCLLSTLCSLLLAIIVIVGITTLILWLVLRPVHLPKYSLDDVNIKSFSLTNSNLTADIVYNITVNNPNRHIGIKYDAITIKTSYDSQVFGQSTIPSFYSGHQNITVVTSELSANNFALSSSSATTLQSEITNDSVPLHVEADAKVRVKIGRYTSPGFWVRVDCDVTIGVNPTKLISKSCKLTRHT